MHPRTPAALAIAVASLASPAFAQASLEGEFEVNGHAILIRCFGEGQPVAVMEGGEGEGFAEGGDVFVGAELGVFGDELFKARSQGGIEGTPRGG